MKHRLAVVLPTFFCIYTVCYYCAYLLRCDFQITPQVFDWFRYTLAIVLGIKFTICLATGEWRRTFRYASLQDIEWVVAAATLAASVILIVEVTMLRPAGFPIPRSVIVIDWVLSVVASAGFRMAARLYTESLRPLLLRQSANPTLIYGAGPEGISILRAIRAGNTEFSVVGLVSDGPRKQRSIVAGVRVYSRLSSWKKLAYKTGAKHVLVPGSTPGQEIRDINRECGELSLKVYVIPAVQEIVEGRYKLAIRDVTITDLLRREPAELDIDSIRDYVTDRKVLVTGAAGSIGSELCRQILSLQPRRLVLLDQSEYGMFRIEAEVEELRSDETELRCIIADVTDRTSLRTHFEDERPEIVFHAAAYKHVPMMEHNPREAVRNNVGGTKVVVDLAAEFQCERFVLISTDKAVRPTSVMGSTKLVAEKYVQAVSARSESRFVTVRFGNVLNSAGSVIPTFRRQIERGGPVTVTHPDMTRFFMTIPEAVQLVLQAGAVGLSGDILILEMGEPVKIVDLARDMIALSGLKCPEDIEIVFSGVRPGEKLYEELFYKSEAGTRQVRDKIFCAKRDPSRLTNVEDEVSSLLKTAADPQNETLQALNELVATFVKAENWTKDGDIRHAA